MVFNHETLAQIVEHFLNNNLFRGGAVNQVQVDDIEQGRFLIDPDDKEGPVEKRYTVKFRNMLEVTNESE